MQSTSRSFNVDNVAPALDITDGPAGPTNDPTPTFEFSAGSDATVMECSVDGETYRDCGSGTYTAESLDDAAYNFSVRAHDAGRTPLHLSASSASCTTARIRSASASAAPRSRT